MIGFTSAYLFLWFYFVALSGAGHKGLVRSTMTCVKSHDPPPVRLLLIYSVHCDVRAVDKSEARQT